MVFKLPNLVARTHVQPIALGIESHRLIKQSLIDRQSPVTVAPHQHQAIGLVGRESQTDGFLL